MPAAGVHVWFVTTHLGIGLHNTQQTEEARQLVVWLKTLLPTGEIVLTGDFNRQDLAPTCCSVHSLLCPALHVQRSDRRDHEDHSEFGLPHRQLVCSSSLELHVWIAALTLLAFRIACGDGSPGYTFDSGKPFKRIDYLWYSPGVSCVKNAGQVCASACASVLSSNACRCRFPTRKPATTGHTLWTFRSAEDLAWMSV